MDVARLRFGDLTSEVKSSVDSYIALLLLLESILTHLLQLQNSHILHRCTSLQPYMHQNTLTLHFPLQENVFGKLQLQEQIGLAPFRVLKDSWKRAC